MAKKSKELSEYLKAGPVTVTFTKVDGTERVMRCTTNPNLVPESMRPETNGPKNSEIHRVFDLENQAWRSFRVDSVTSFES